MINLNWIKRNKFVPKNFVLDVDGVLTTGHYIYSKRGKEYKIFGQDDGNTLKHINKILNVYFVTCDYDGFDISKKRINDWGFFLHKVPLVKRYEYLQNDLKLNLAETIYMGDSVFDVDNFKHFPYTICPNNSYYLLKFNANFVTHHNGGDRAAAEACLHIEQNFLKDLKNEHRKV
jgi:3-deoxy-D-manno-octulosonate 8-phosphate phosphatase (KDO 8-P phosphatase)